MSGLQDATYLRFLFTNVISSSCDRHLSHRAAKGFQSMLAISALWVSVFEKSNFSGGLRPKRDLTWCGIFVFGLIKKLPFDFNSS